MNIIDTAILLILAIMLLGGLYRGFLANVVSLAMTLVAWLLALLLMSSVAGAVKSNETIYNMMLYYTEGSEYVAKTDVELTRVPASTISLDTLNEIIERADMPIPLGDKVRRNVSVEAFAGEGYSTLGDYFNLTIVSVVTNILSLLLVFAIVRVLLGFIHGCVRSAIGGYPALARMDGAIGAGVGLLHGIILVYLLFMLVPIALTVLPRLYTYLEESFFGEFFYRVNPFIRAIP